MKVARILALGVFVAALAGCAVGPNYRTPETPTPEGFAAAGSAATAGAGANAPASAAPVDFTAWWHALNDSELDSLIARAISGNPDVLIALDRLQAARTYEAAIIGTVLPEAEAGIGAGRAWHRCRCRGRRRCRPPPRAARYR